MPGRTLAHHWLANLEPQRVFASVHGVTLLVNM